MIGVRLICVLFAAFLGIYMIIRSAIHFAKREKAGVNVKDDPGLCESALVDFLMLALGVFLVLTLVLFLFR